jgi:hypothetical protein
MEIGSTFVVRGMQALETCANIVFLDALQYINKEYAKEVVEQYLCPFEPQLWRKRTQLLFLKMSIVFLGWRY